MKITGDNEHQEVGSRISFLRERGVFHNLQSLSQMGERSDKANHLDAVPQACVSIQSALSAWLESRSLLWLQCNNVQQ